MARPEVEPRLAVVVGHADLGDDDRVVRLLTAESGRVNVVARGARRARSPWGAALDTANLVRFRARRGRGELERLEAVELVAAPRRARNELGRLAFASYACELCGALAGEGAPSERLHGLLLAALQRAEGELPLGQLTRLALEAKALTFAGLLPALQRCARCGEALGPRASWSAAVGGACHAACGGEFELPVALLDAIEDARRRPIAEAAETHLTTRHAALLADFARYHLGRDLRSLALLLETEATPQMPR